MRPMMAPPTTPIVAPTPTSWQLSLTSILPVVVTLDEHHRVDGDHPIVGELP